MPMPSSLAASLRPRLFISFSWSRKAFAQELKAKLRADSASVWLDLERVVIGDSIKSEIEHGIRGCDEVLLLLCRQSMASRWVARELRMARDLDRTIWPIVLEPLGDQGSPWLSPIHYLDVSQDDASTKINRIVAGLCPASPKLSAVRSGEEPLVFKRFACRGIWPGFEPSMLLAPDRARVLRIATEADLVCQRYGPSSALRLNAGLLDCVAENWDRGLSHLRAFAHASRSFAGWYFYALHLNRTRDIRTLGIQDHARQAADNAASMSSHPLASVLRAIYRTAADNESPRHIFAALDAVARGEPQDPETSGEVMRFFWCMKSSLAGLGIGAHDFLAYMRRGGLLPRAS